MRTGLLLAVLGGLALAAIAGAVIAWIGIGEVEISWHGYLAMGLGILLSLALGVGLMALVFYSSRQGYDDGSQDGS